MVLGREIESTESNFIVAYPMDNDTALKGREGRADLSYDSYREFVVRTLVLPEIERRILPTIRTGNRSVCSGTCSP